MVLNAAMHQAMRSPRKKCKKWEKTFSFLSIQFVVNVRTDQERTREKKEVSPAVASLEDLRNVEPKE